jgi:hypothetical protein
VKTSLPGAAVEQSIGTNAFETSLNAKHANSSLPFTIVALGIPLSAVATVIEVTKRPQANMRRRSQKNFGKPAFSIELAMHQSKAHTKQAFATPLHNPKSFDYCLLEARCQKMTFSLLIVLNSSCATRETRWMRSSAGYPVVRGSSGRGIAAEHSNHSENMIVVRR